MLLSAPARTGPPSSFPATRPPTGFSKVRREGGARPVARASPAHAADAGLQPDAVGGLDVLLRHLLGPHRLRPAPGRFLQLQPRGHGLGWRNSSQVGTPLPPPPPLPPPKWTPPPASDEDQALPQPAGQSVTCARHCRRARPRPTRTTGRKALPAADTRHRPPLKFPQTLAYSPPRRAHARSHQPLRLPRLWADARRKGKRSLDTVLPRLHRRFWGSSFSAPV